VLGLRARERVQLGLPAEEETPARTIRSATLEAVGEEGKGLTGATFRGEPVEFREARPAPALPRLARSAVMELAMAGNFGTIEAARFSGGVRFEEGDLWAVARDGRYTMKTGLLNLTGIHEKTKQPPRVVDEQATIEATTIDIELEGRKINAAGSVKSEMPARRQTSPGTPDPTAAKMPSLLKGDQPVSATAAKLVYDGSASHAVYSGGARLWQGNTTIKGEEIVLDDQKGDLSAEGNVVTNLTPVTVRDADKAGSQGKAEQPAASLATAKKMVYEEELRRVTYTTGAHLIGPEGDLSADRIELFLAAEDSEIERIEGYRDVVLKTKDGRTATGARVTYFAPDERYVMHGTPVKIVEECRETTGRSLTFFRSADRIIVDGNEQKRTETKGASACGSGPRSSD
jgi:lipopolysaccharide export system protein LptA